MKMKLSSSITNDVSLQIFKSGILQSFPSNNRTNLGSVAGLVLSELVRSFLGQLEEHSGRSMLKSTDENLTSLQDFESLFICSVLVWTGY